MARSAKSPAPAYRNRIIGAGEENPEQLVANPLNYRIHPKSQQAGLEAVLSTVGWVDQIIVNKRTGFVVDGHLRVSLALRNGEKKVPVIYVDLDEQEESLVLATLDPLSAMAATDKKQLESLMASLPAQAQNVQSLLESIRKRQRLPPIGAPPDPDAAMKRVDAIAEKWGTALGQTWALGDHRLICGDALQVKAICDVILTDPPYGIDLDTDYSNTEKPVKGAYRGRKYRPVIGDDKPFDAGPIVENFGNPPEQFWFGADYYRHTLPWGERDGSWLVWDKRVDDAHDDVIGSAFELVASKKRHARVILRWQWSNWTSHHNDGHRREHPTEKPVALFQDIIDRWSKPGQTIADPFAGVGTTIMACEHIGRKAIAVEIDPAYCAVALERWAEMTDRKPELIAEDAPPPTRRKRKKARS